MRVRLIALTAAAAIASALTPPASGQTCNSPAGCNMLRVSQVTEGVTLAVSQVGASNAIDVGIRGAALERTGYAAAVLFQSGLGNSVSVVAGEPEGASDFDLLLALEQNGTGNIASITIQAFVVAVGISQDGSGNAFALAGDLGSLDVAARQSGEIGSTAELHLAEGDMSVRFIQAGGGAHSALLELVNPGGGMLTVDWSQSGVGDVHAVALSCGNVIGCDLSYLD